MLSTIIGFMRGCLSLLLFVLNNIIWLLPFVLFALIKVIVPFRAIRTGCSGLLEDIASCWASINIAMIEFFIPIQWQISGNENLPKNNWYLVIANHQSWVDVVALLKVLNWKVPFTRVFLKKQLKRVPILGFYWMALDYPFMERYSKSLLQKKPHLKGKDFETTMKSCEKFRQRPTSVMSFVEGTRFTQHKHDQQQSPYRYLLKPRAGGVAYTLQVLGDKFKDLIDITIIYEQQNHSIWDLLCGRLKTIHVQVDRKPIDPTLIGDYQNDQAFRLKFQQWLNQTWQQKDDVIKAFWDASACQKTSGRH
jgi:1-acyl-sn-glycerol-3-phosphate acyltransferase